MAIYKVVGNNERLESVKVTSMKEAGIMEQDLQRMLREDPDALEEGLFIIDEESQIWEDSNRRIDLLALDTKGRLVVVELKRGETGDHMELQALRYTAMAANMTWQQLVNTHRLYMTRLGLEGDAAERIRECLPESDEARFSPEAPRIILVSENFGKELTTSVMWLNDQGLDITCLRIQSHRDGQGVLLETSQTVPLPEAKDYLVRIRNREEEQEKARQTSFGTYTQGGEEFLHRVDSAEPEDLAKLRKLYDWAVELQGEKLATLRTYANGPRCNLLVELPKSGNAPTLVRVIMDTASLSIIPWNFRQYSPVSAEKLNGLLVRGRKIQDRNHSFHVKLTDMVDEALNVLTEAYREAKENLARGEEAG